MIRRGKWKRKQKGQAVVEYVILVVVVALAAFFVLTAFSDRLRDMITGATKTLGGEAHENADKSAEELTKELGADGIE
ncbi:MAG: hypothetical protein IKD46_03585 [Lentisphaeria bacterium]|nr:hypothetical protein [Lentisphaeria bacterium]